MKKIGETFRIELKKAGLYGLPFSWGDDGVINFSDDITLEQKNAVLAIYDAHNPLSIDYIQARKSEYPPIEDYIDGIVKGNSIQIQNYIDACLAVKQKYPKPI